jgi:hypothetical protein
MNYRILLSLVYLFSACNLINPEERLPAYIYLQPFDFQITKTNQGSGHQKITEAWLTVNGEFLGVYNLPSAIPILQEGNADIRIDAGIKDNGISTLPEIYPFFLPYLSNITLSPLQTDTLLPTTTYREEITFAFIEHFEGDFQLFTDDLDGDPITKIDFDTENVFEGRRSGRITLTSNNRVVQVASRTDQKYKGLLNKGAFVYLELTYKTDVELGIGLIGHYNNLSKPAERLFEPILRPRKDWNKVYLNLSQTAFVLNADEYQVAFVAVLPPDMATGSIWLDNIKLVHF